VSEYETIVKMSESVDQSIPDPKDVSAIKEALELYADSDDRYFGNVAHRGLAAFNRIYGSDADSRLMPAQKRDEIERRYLREHHYHAETAIGLAKVCLFKCQPDKALKHLQDACEKIDAELEIRAVAYRVASELFES
jgi:hypothetical protein